MVRTDMCSADTCQLQGWDLHHLLGAPGPQWHWLSVSPQWHGSRCTKPAQHWASPPCWLPSAHSVYVCAWFAGNSPHGCIYKISISKCLYFLFLQQKKYESLGKISKIYVLLFSPSPLWTDLWGKFRVCHRGEKPPSLWHTLSSDSWKPCLSFRPVSSTMAHPLGSP